MTFRFVSRTTGGMAGRMNGLWKQWESGPQVKKRPLVLMKTFELVWETLCCDWKVRNLSWYWQHLQVPGIQLFKTFYNSTHNFISMKTEEDEKIQYSVSLCVHFAASKPRFIVGNVEIPFDFKFHIYILQVKCKMVRLTSSKRGKKGAKMMKFAPKQLERN